MYMYVELLTYLLMEFPWAILPAWKYMSLLMLKQLTTHCKIFAKSLIWATLTEIMTLNSVT